AGVRDGAAVVSAGRWRRHAPGCRRPLNRSAPHPGPAMAPDPPRDSTLRVEPPEPVRQRFAQLAEGAEPLPYGIPTDRPLSAEARVEWILVSPRRLTVISENGTVADELNLPLERISAIENEESIGAGLIRAVVDGEQIDIAE